MDISVDRGLWLRHLAMQKGLDGPTAFAGACGIKRQTAANWFKGGGIKSHRDRMRVTEVLGVSLDQLMNGPYGFPLHQPEAPPPRMRAVFQRRGSGWSRDVFQAMLSSLVPAYEEALFRHGEEEVCRLLQLQIVEIAPSLDVLRKVHDLMRAALYKQRQTRPPSEPAYTAPRGSWAYPQDLDWDPLPPQEATG